MMEMVLPIIAFQLGRPIVPLLLIVLVLPIMMLRSWAYGKRWIAMVIPEIPLRTIIAVIPVIILGLVLPTMML